MPLFAVPIELPPHVVELRAGDIDSDGIEELVAIERKEHGTAPDSMAITVYNIGPQGRTEDQWSINLKSQPLLIDIEDGIWAIGRTGLMQITPEGLVTKVKTQTALVGLGQTTPMFADVFVDLEDDGLPEGIFANGNTIRVVGSDGKERASIPVRSRGELSLRNGGGTQIVSSAVSPMWSVDDFNGDGIKDLLLPDGKELIVVPFGTDGAQSKQTISLPIDITRTKRERSAKKGETKKRVISVWLEDLDGDQRTDFAAQLWVTEGGWMGAEGELVYAKGTGTGFADLQRMKSENAVLLVRLIDLDGDGDKELASAEVDFGVANLTRAMLSQKIKVDLVFREMVDGTYGESTDLHSVVVPVGNDRDPPVKLEHDLTGDGIPDLVTSQGNTSVSVFKGTGGGFESTPLASLDIGFVQGEDQMWVGDLTGDGRAEIVIWRSQSSEAKVLQLQ